MKSVDLHTHTTASDGTYTPSELVRYADSLGISAIAVTDHDTTEGLAEAISTASSLDIEIVPAIEFSTRFKNETESTMVHVLGYYINPDNQTLQNELKKIVEDRDERNREIVYMFNRDGIEITYEQMKERFGDVIGRPHLAQILVEHGLAKDTTDAFNRFVGKGMNYWIPRKTLKLHQVFELITNAGGVPIVAHPFEYKSHMINDLIKHCLSLGLKGVECYHSSHSSEQMAFLENECCKFNLLRTGGSDFHGHSKPDVKLGVPFVPYTFYEKLRDAKDSMSN